MLKIDNNLLVEVGLGSMPDHEKNGFLKHIYETLEMRVGVRLADQMSNDQLDEFEKYFEAKDDAGAFKWLETNFPNYKDIVQQEFDKLKVEVTQTAPQILAAGQAAQASQDSQATQTMQQPQQPQQPQSQPEPAVAPTQTAPQQAQPQQYPQPQQPPQQMGQPQQSDFQQSVPASPAPNPMDRPSQEPVSPQLSPVSPADTAATPQPLQQEQQQEQPQQPSPDFPSQQPPAGPVNQF